MDVRGHWESVYQSKNDTEVSWTQADPATSVSLIREARRAPGRVIDVGGGTSALAGRLLDLGYSVAVLDVSPTALSRAHERLGPRGDGVEWIVADVTKNPDLGTFDVWHDRAVFHFLTEAADRAAYAGLLSRSVPVGGHAVIATFAPDGPEKCSGLPVRRYDAKGLAGALGADFELRKSVSQTHHTPWGKPQSFQYSLFRRV
jgi:SAM-dependent methyltransferase